MSDPLLRIRNRHIAGSGDPPIVNDDDPNIYTGYFENSFGEQVDLHMPPKIEGGVVAWRRHRVE